MSQSINLIAGGVYDMQKKFCNFTFFGIFLVEKYLLLTTINIYDNLSKIIYG